MSKNPFVNASFAILYIVTVVLVMQFGQTLEEREDNILMPIAFLSLFVLSAATMAYLFFYQPVLMYLEGQKQEAGKLFVRTIFAFGLYTAVILTLMFSVFA